MIYAIKLLMMVLLASGAVSVLARPAFAELLSRKAYRNAWTAIFIAAVFSFLSLLPSIFFVGATLTALVAARLLGGDMRARIAAWLMLLMVFPALQVSLDGVGGINRILVLDHFRLLTILLLAPDALRLLFRRREPGGNPFIAMDVFVLGYQLLLLVEASSYGTFTGLLRMAIEAILGVVIPYYVLTRGLRTLADLRFVAAHFMLGCVFVAAVAGLETLIQRNVYAPLQYIYGVVWQSTHTLMRGGLLRVQSTTPQPILLACSMMVALGVWTWLSGHRWKRPATMFVYFLLLLTIAATFSRGPWLCTGLFFASFLALRRCPPALYAVIFFALIGTGIAIEVGGAEDAVAGALKSLFGTSKEDFGSIDYRRRLIDSAMGLIRQSPVWGVPNYLAYMQDLKQGEGMIDLVNTYLLATLNSGLVGLTILLVPQLIVLKRLLVKLSQVGSIPSAKRFLTAIISVHVAIGVVLLTTSSFFTLPYLITFVMAAALVYVRIDKQELAADAETPVESLSQDRFGAAAVAPYPYIS